jgi:hypothetical protein
MRLEPGPVPLLDAAPAATEPDHDTFLAFEESWYQTLGEADREIGSLVDPAFERMSADQLFLLEVPIDEAGDELERLAGRNVAEGLDDVLGVREEVDGDVIAATNEAVAESWQEIPPKFEPGPDQEGGGVIDAPTEPAFQP